MNTQDHYDQALYQLGYIINTLRGVYDSPKSSRDAALADELQALWAKHKETPLARINQS